MDEKYYIEAIKEDDSFNTKDGKKIVPVLMVKTHLPDTCATDWATAYLLEESIFLDCAYVPYYVQQRNGSYKKKFRKEN